MKKLWRWLFYAPKHEKLTDENIVYMLLPSIIGILLCAACLTGLTVAWYSVSIETQPVKLSTKAYYLNAEVKSSNGDVVSSNPSDDSGTTYDLTAGNYTVTLSATGVGSGYCAVSVGDKTYNTKSVNAGEEFTFTLNVETPTFKVTFTPKWGKHPDGETIDVNDGTPLTLN